MKKLITSLAFGLLVASFGCSYQPNRIPQPRQDRSQTSTKTRRVTTGTSTTTSRHTKGRDSLATDSTLPPGSKPVNYFITHHASGVVNYSLEYDVHKLHARWVAFSFDEVTSRDSISRTNAWRWDPKVPKVYDTSSFFPRSGYSRGHLVASEDRTFSREANEQTFYYTNMSPQLQSHNAGVWHRLENKVQQWGHNRKFCDKLYVAKGATIREDQIKEERLDGKVVIPRYFWMAVLMKKGRSYHAIAFLTEHRSYAKDEHIDQMTLSIRELEQFTGLDFFYHLPDEVENRVEEADPKSPAALRLWWGK